jgi:hypothetical protein
VYFAHAAHAGPAADTDDSISNKGTTVSTALSGNLVINVMTNVFGNFTATCTTVAASFKVPATGLKTNLIPQSDGQPIDISGCTDSLGGTDTIATSGTWKLTFKDVVPETETAKEPNTGDKVQIGVPLSGASLSSSIDPACVLTLDTAVVSKLKINYNDKGTGTIPAGENPGTVTAGSGCPTGMTVTETLNAATLLLSTPVHDVS